MDFLKLVQAVGPEGLLSVLVAFLIYNNAKLIDRIIDKILGNGNLKK